MTQLAPPHSSRDRREGSLPPRPPQAARLLAEWVSFGLSAAIVLALAGYLVYDALRQDGPIVPIEVHIALDKAAVANDRHVVPITVRNKGLRTVKDVKIEVTERGAEPREFDIDYLPEGAEETVYFYLDANPQRAKLDARAVQYRLE